MCSGRVDMAFVLRALRAGTDGVFIGGCYLGECHYITDGNYYAMNMVQLCKRLLEHIGLNPGRLRMEELSAGEGIRFAELMNEFSRQVRDLGPVGVAEGLDPDEMNARLSDLIRLVPYLKLVNREKLKARPRSSEEFEGLFTPEEVAEQLRAAPTYYIDPARCRACMICAKRCPVDAIAGGKSLVHVIDQSRCIKCGTCLEACPPRFGAVVKVVGEPVPPFVPTEPRPLVRERKTA